MERQLERMADAIPGESPQGQRMADSVQTLGVDSKTQTEWLGAKEKARRKKVQGEVLAHWEEQGLPEKLHEDRGEKAVENGPGPREPVGERKPWVLRPP